MGRELKVAEKQPYLSTHSKVKFHLLLIPPRTIQTEMGPPQPPTPRQVVIMAFTIVTH